MLRILAFLFKNGESRYYLIVSLPGAPADRQADNEVVAVLLKMNQ
mgnify:CR=1 FL=1